MKRGLLLLVASLIGIINYTLAQVPYPGENPGRAQAKSSASSFILENEALKLRFSFNANKLKIIGFTDKVTGDDLVINSPLFELTLPEGETLTSDAFILKSKPKTVSDQQSKKDKAYEAQLENTASGISVLWKAVLEDNANYIRQTITLSTKNTVQISGIRLINLPASGVEQAGSVDGTPLIWKNMFFAIEHPMSQISETKNTIGVLLPRQEAISSEHPVTVSSVAGVSPAGQLRRAFLYYTERERARPYHQMLHYNSWYDLSWGDRKLDEKGCLDRIRMFGDSLIVKRKTPLKAFLFDDGWDDNKTLWQFNSGFPSGFTKVKEAANDYNAGIGVWISPWGGYDTAKEQRLEFGKKQNPPFETNENGFSLAGPVYNKRFKDVTKSFISDYNVSMFKFDGVGAGNGASGASLSYQKDIESFLDLITGMRSLKPELYFSLTVGTWPSVYWLNYGDAIWRAGEDTGMSGEGAKRQQWITYRDAQTYKNIVRRAPLFPLNAVMNHGICIADNGLPGGLEMDDQHIEDEIWSFFGTGTSLQELYVNPHKLNSRNWNCLSDAARWSKQNEQILSDVHWVGGDPDKGEIYGFAAWRNQKGVLTLRNPSSQEKEFTVNVKQVFEIPGTLSDNYNFYNAKKAGNSKLYSGGSFLVKLKPYEVRVMNAELNP
ncbi:hypothetical protein [Desertivirga xinjiangensis]|uniref:hypothetical protein n=1 Tax=Desertivirga xinjiangensis TaxID=539206 RepID=UPI00210AD185|nr:hypothetical protein [Pedobacter xinjiangensis]